VKAAALTAALVPRLAATPRARPRLGTGWLGLFVTPVARDTPVNAAADLVTAMASGSDIVAISASCAATQGHHAVANPLTGPLGGYI
jgi:hypothetical protein